RKIKSIERLDSKGSMLSGMAAGIFELRLEPEEQAKNLKFEVDLFLVGLVKIDKALGDPDTIKELVVELVGKQAAAVESGPWQTVAKTADGKLLCKVGKAF